MQGFCTSVVPGYEISFFPWLVSVGLKHLLGYKNLFFYRKNFLAVDFPKGSMIVCYLFPNGMTLLEEKLFNEESQISVVLSNTFAFTHKKPKEIIRLDDIYKTPLYRY